MEDRRVLRISSQPTVIPYSVSVAPPASAFSASPVSSSGADPAPAAQRDWAEKRIDDICAAVSTSLSEDLLLAGLRPSVAALASRKPRPLASSEDVCRNCTGTTARGHTGHMPWDELEMLRHGWCTEKGKHLTQHKMGKDEVDLLAEEAVDKHGIRSQTLAANDEDYHALSRLASRDSRVYQVGGVSFGDEPEVVYIEHTDSASETNVSASLSGVVSNSDFEGGVLTTVNRPPITAKLWRSPDRFAYVQSGPRESLLILGTASSDPNDPSFRMAL